MSRTAFRSERHAALEAAFPRDTSSYRLHSQHFRPAPARRVNWIRRVLRAVVGALT